MCHDMNDFLVVGHKNTQAQSAEANVPPICNNIILVWVGILHILRVHLKSPDLTVQQYRTLQTPQFHRESQDSLPMAGTHS